MIVLWPQRDYVYKRWILANTHPPQLRCELVAPHLPVYKNKAHKEVKSQLKFQYILL
jgi:hypothetical protein